MTVVVDWEISFGWVYFINQTFNLWDKSTKCIEPLISRWCRIPLKESVVVGKNSFFSYIWSNANQYTLKKKKKQNIPLKKWSIL